MIVGGSILYYAMEKTVVPANKTGKIATISFYVGIIAVAFEVNKFLSYSLITTAVGITVIAFIRYFINFNNTKIMIDK